MSIQDTVKRIVKENAGESYNWKVGTIVEHPEHGKVIIVGGYYLDPTFGRVSNHFSWRKLNKNNKPVGEIFSGYGWK